MVLKRLWNKRTVIVGAVVVAAAVITALVWPVTDLIAAHDVGVITGAPRAVQLQTARESVRTQLLTLGAGVFAAGALVYTARNFTLSRSTFRATEKRVLNERFIAIAAQLGDAQAAVRLAGVHAMAGLADDWEENRQTCIDVLCAYLRIPYEPDPGEEAPAAERLAFGASREVRHTVIGIIARHLQPDAVISWRGRDFDFTGVVFDGGDFEVAEFTGSTVSFDGAEFTGGTVDFGYAKFSGGMVSFNGAKFTGGTVSFNGAKFIDWVVSFNGAEFSGGTVSFNEAEFIGWVVSFGDAKFIADGTVSFDGAKFTGGTVSFFKAKFSGGTVSFEVAVFPAGGTVSFDYAEFSSGTVSFTRAVFSGAEVDFSNARDWSHPPRFDWEGTPPAGVKLPAGSGGESR
jgi:uncharacterized protein YjbI with pentapeptide repeats